MNVQRKQYLPPTFLTVPDRVYRDISSAKVNSKIISLYFTIKLLIAENPAELKYLAVYLKEDVEVLSEALDAMQKLKWLTIDDENQTVQLM